VVLLKVVTACDFNIYRNGELLHPTAKAMTKPYTILDVPSVDAQTSDYGMSRGVYETPTSKSMRIDPRLIFILDYPKEVADYSYNTDDWPQFFIKDPAEWEKTYGKAASTWGYTWLTFQSLRHFGKANVLFCDGSVETVGTDAYGTATPNEVLSGRYLDETNPLWKCQGN
jgi:prepilin-type processing-associated H-X9-DG protein